MAKVNNDDGSHFYISDEHHDFVKKFKWRADKRGTNSVYFYTSLGSKKVYLHRLIFGIFSKIQIDHADRDQTNNRIENLRPCSGSQNLQNIVKSRKKSKYRGVFKMRNKWVASISVNQKNRRKYGFDNEEDAALAYNEMAKQIYGDFAVLNLVDRKETT